MAVLGAKKLKVIEAIKAVMRARLESVEALCGSGEIVVEMEIPIMAFFGLRGILDRVFCYFGGERLEDKKVFERGHWKTWLFFLLRFTREGQGIVEMRAWLRKDVARS